MRAKKRHTRREAGEQNADWRGTAWFAATLFVSAALLFVVQPMFAKMVLPLLGGAPAVWNTCLVFYQAALLAGYVYAHLSLQWLGPRKQAILHLTLLCLPWVVLPIHVARDWTPPPDAFPVPWLWMLLAVSLGLPLVAVSASAPMLQAWFTQTRSESAKDPYFLYAASNLGSLLALLGYPLLIESNLTLAGQAWWWAVGYGLLMTLVAGCAIVAFRSAKVCDFRGAEGDNATVIDSPSLSWRRRLHWLALSLVPSSLLLGVTTHISTDVAAIPLLWVIPLALYLTTFVLVFARRPILPLAWMLRVEPYVIVAAAGALLWHAYQPMETVLLASLHLLTFFVIAMVCHGQLAADRPAGSRLTEFYLWMSLGGVLGGLLSALVAPILFSSVLEYPLMLALACALRPPVFPAGPGRVGKPVLRRWLLAVIVPLAVLVVCCGAACYVSVPGTKLIVVGLAAVAAFLLRQRPLRFACGVAALSVASVWCAEGGLPLLHQERTFFGVLRVQYDPVRNMNELMHGSTSHGQQSLDPARRREPWGYFHRKGPLGKIFQAVQSHGPLGEIGVLGLGTGAISAYGEPGQRITFYEIDPAVERIAREQRYFTYLADCRARVEVVMGDARLSLQRQTDRRFELLIVDVFSSDSVPVHLINRDALRLYRDRLTDGGLLAVHISSRYLDLKPVLGTLAKDAGMAAVVCSDIGRSRAVGKEASVWVAMAGTADVLGPLAADPDWEPLRPSNRPPWTDDFSDVVAAMKWNASWTKWQPSEWWKSSTAQTHISLAAALSAEGRNDDAIDHYEKALQLDPRNADIHCNLAVLLGRQKRFDEAIVHFQTALEIQPNDADTRCNFGANLVRLARLDEAIEQFRKAVQLQPANAEARYNLGVALERQQQVNEAMVQFQQALDLALAQDKSALATAARAHIKVLQDHSSKTK